MLPWKKWIAPVASLVLIAGFQQMSARAADEAKAEGKATITVTVVDAAGKPVSGATVSLFPGQGKKAKGAAGATTQPDGADAKPARPVALQTSTTGADGTATLTKVADGAYGVGARMKGQGNGREKVIVADGKDAAVSVTLKSKRRKRCS